MKNKYFITYWDGIPFEYFSEERMVEAIECGFNLIQGGKVGGYKGDTPHNLAYDAPMTQKALEICEKYGVKYMVFDIRIKNLVDSDPSDEEIDKVVCEVCNDFKNYSALHSYLIKDEPDASYFPRLKKIVDAFKKHDPDHIPYINLLPNYAPPSMLGTPTYEDHVEKFIEAVKPDVLCYDHYHLTQTSRPVEEFLHIDSDFEAQVYAASLNRSDRDGFYANLEVIRKHGLKNDIPYMLIVLLVEHGPYRYLTRAELYFEVWQTLAYGCSTLSYYNYWALPERWNYKNAIISHDGKKCQHYWDVKEINKNIEAIGNCIANTRSEAVFHVGNKNEKDGVVPFEPHMGIDDITGGELTVGFFEDKTVVIANKDFDNPADVTLKTDRALEIFDVESERFVPLESKQLKINAGEGVYLKIAE
jgi:hypothetical protein